MKSTFRHVAFAFCMALTGHAVAQDRIEVVAMDPHGGSLPLDAALNLKVHYQSTQPVRVQARGLRDGHEVPGATNASPAYRAGSGDVLAWISYPQYTAVDGIEVRLFDARWHPLTSVKVPVDADWSRGAPQVPVAPWVRDLAQAQTALIEREVDAAKGNGIFDFLFGGLIMLMLPAYCLLQIVLPLVWKGRWRLAAMLPLALMVPAFVVSLFALAAGSNLWPIWMILLAPLAFLYLAVLGIARFFVRAK